MKVHSLLKKSFILLAVAVMVLTVSYAGSAVQAAEKVIKIGVIGPMKFVYGDHPWKGAQMAVDKINSEGGIKVKDVAHKIKLFKADDNCLMSTPDAISAMERLVTLKKVDFVIGGYRSETTLAQQEIAADNKVIFIANGGGAHPELCTRIAKNYDRYKYFFRTWPDASKQSLFYMAQAEVAMRKIKSELGVEKPKVAILIDKAKYADDMVKYAESTFPKMGAEVVGVWRHAFTANNVSAELSAIRSSGAHMIYVIAAGPAGNVIARQWGELQIPAALVGVNVEGMEEGHWDATGGYCNYMTTSMGFTRVKISEQSIPFYDTFKKRFDETPMLMAPLTYDIFHFLKAAIERAGTIDSDAVVVELEKTDYMGTMGKMAFNPPGHATPHDAIWGPQNITALGVQWRDGKQVIYWPDGNEIHPALVEDGAPTGWSGVKYEGTVTYELPPWIK